jgi:hypothetical protein
MKAPNIVRFSTLFAALFLAIVPPTLAQNVPALQMAELSRKLQLTEQQKKDLTPIVQHRDNQIKALKANTSMGKLQKLRKVEEIQGNFKSESAKVLNPEQVTKLEALQAERRAKIMGQ